MRVGEVEVRKATVGQGNFGSRGMRGGLALAGLLLLGTPSHAWAAPEAPAAEASELVVQVTELEKQVKQHAVDKAVAALLEDARLATKLHKACGETVELKRRCLDVHETVLKSVKEDGERIAVFDQLVATGDPEAGKLLRPYLRQPNVKEADRLLLAAIKAAGPLACTETAEPLLLIFEKSKDMGAATASLEALGRFREVKNRREKILETVAKNVQKNMPGTRAGPRGGGSGGVGDPVPDSSTAAPNPNGSDPGARWAALSAVLPKALNELTGRSIATTEAWLHAVRQVDKTSELFVQ